MTVEASPVFPSSSIETRWPVLAGLGSQVLTAQSARHSGESWLAWGRRVGASEADLLTASAEVLEVAVVDDLRGFRAQGNDEALIETRYRGE